MIKRLSVADVAHKDPYMMQKSQTFLKKRVRGGCHHSFYVSIELDLALKAKNFKRAVKVAIRCVYCIRKTLFHGESDISDVDVQIVQDVNPLLKELIRFSILKYVRMH